MTNRINVGGNMVNSVIAQGPEYRRLVRKSLTFSEQPVPLGGTMTFVEKPKFIFKPEYLVVSDEAAKSLLLERYIIGRETVVSKALGLDRFAAAFWKRLLDDGILGLESLASVFQLGGYTAHPHTTIELSFSNFGKLPVFPRVELIGVGLE